MMVAVGPVGRSFLGTHLPSQYPGTGLALLASMWVIGEAFGSGAGGQLIDHFPIRSVLYGASGLPLLSAALVILVFRGYTDTHGSRSSTEPVEATPASQPSVVRVMVFTPAVVLLFPAVPAAALPFLPLLFPSHITSSPPIPPLPIHP